MKKTLAWVLCLSLAAGVVACQHLPTFASDARIIAPGFTGAGVGIMESDAKTPYTNGDLIICLDRPGRAVINAIDSEGVYGGLSLDAFTVIPNTMEQGRDGFDSDSRTIAEHGIAPTGPVVVDTPCPDVDNLTPSPSRKPQTVALILQYSKPTGATAGNTGITIHYTSGGNVYSTSLAWTTTLCAKGIELFEECRKNHTS